MKTLLLRPFVDSTIGNAPPLSIMYLSSYLKSKGQEVKLIDECVDRTDIKAFSVKDRNIRRLLDFISDYKPDVIGMTLFSRELKDIADLCKLLKREFKSSSIVLGGPHPTAMPGETIEQIPECDFVVRGEGEVVLYNLIEGLSQNSKFDGINGISFRDKGNGVHHNPQAGILQDLNIFPFPDRESLIHNYRNRKYSSLVYGSPSDVLITSRGCPFHCSYCFKVCNRYRSRSYDNVLAEIDWIIENIEPQYIQIIDDSFTIQKDRCITILDALIERKYPCKFKVRSRVNAVDEEILNKMKCAGVDTVVYGLESGSQEMLDAFNKKTTVEQNIRACLLTRKAGMNCIGDMILFYPGENRETLKETEAFVGKAKPTAVHFFVLTPLPSTKVYAEAVQSGRLRGGWNIGDETPWVKLDEFRDLDEMERIAKRMFIRTFLSPYRIYSILKSFGKGFLKNPGFTLKMILLTIWKKTKY